MTRRRGCRATTSCSTAMRPISRGCRMPNGRWSRCSAGARWAMRRISPPSPPRRIGPISSATWRAVSGGPAGSSTASAKASTSADGSCRARPTPSRWGRIRSSTTRFSIPPTRPDISRASATITATTPFPAAAGPAAPHDMQETDMGTRGQNRSHRVKGVSRRRLLQSGAAAASAAALVSALRAAFPAGAAAQGAGPEVTKATFGFIALTDFAPLAVANEKGIFAKYGMPDVEVAKQASWGATRDNIVLGGEGGGIDGAHILTPMPYLITSGRVTQNNQPVPMYILARLNVNGQCISVAKAHMGTGAALNSAPLAAEFKKMIAAGKEVKCAMTFPGGTHDML